MSLVGGAILTRNREIAERTKHRQKDRAKRKLNNSNRTQHEGKHRKADKRRRQQNKTK